jgi:hypothetical protein
MELASMLAGEPLSDHPHSVCPVVGAFLRTYNDAIDDKRRQDLYEYASLAVGTRSSRRVQRRRIEMCMRFAAEIAGRSGPGEASLWLRRLLSSNALVVKHAVGDAIAAGYPHDAVLRFVRQLVDVGHRGEAPVSRIPESGGGREVPSRCRLSANEVPSRVTFPGTFPPHSGLA